jgi:hypothetical protein
VFERDLWYVRLCRLYYHFRVNGDPEGSESPLFGAIRGWIEGLVHKGRDLGVVRNDLPESLLISVAMGLAEAIDRRTTSTWDGFDSADRQSLLRREVELFRRLLE